MSPRVDEGAPLSQATRLRRCVGRLRSGRCRVRPPEAERLKIRDRARAADFREKARRGLVVSGTSAYGYRPDPAAPGTLVIRASPAARCIACHGVRSHPVPVALAEQSAV